MLGGMLQRLKAFYSANKPSGVLTMAVYRYGNARPSIAPNARCRYE